MGTDRSYVRFAALGDSTTYGIGDPSPDGGWRGWARLLAGQLAVRHDVSFCNLAVPGATSLTVRYGQLDEALTHRPTHASLVVGINDTLRSNWAAERVRGDLLHCAARLHEAGAVLLTARFHDHGEVFGLPRLLRGGLRARIERVNAAYDEIHERFHSVHLDLADCPEVGQREFWSIDRLHPSERGHRTLAGRYADLLSARGLPVDPPDAGAASAAPARTSELRWLVAEGGPWLGRRARDLGPWAARLALTRHRPDAYALHRLGS